MIELIGWIGSMLFSFCALPQMITSIRDPQTTRALSWGFLNMWAVGEVLCFIYVYSQPVMQIPLLANYILNSIMLAVIITFKIKSRNK
jgi:uncharacterized protein with PQ loop repeat